MRELLRQLDDALERSDPGLHGHLRPAASPADLDEAERAIGSPLPAELRQLYEWRDGQTGKGTFPAHGSSVAKGLFLPLAQALECRRRQPRISRSWFPLIDGGSGDYLCVDVESGAVVEFQHETAKRPVVFPSLAAWAAEVAAGYDRDQAADTPVATPLTAYLDRHREPARSWQELRSWIRGMKQCGSAAVFANIALAADEQTEPQHPAMARLSETVQRWLAAPSSETLEPVRDAVAARNRTFVPAGQVSFAAQHAAQAALSDNLDRACDCALHAVAKAAPGIVDGGADAEASCLELQRRLRAKLSE